MSGLYLTWLADELRAAGLAVVEYGGWMERARSSGGYDRTPVAVFWHHTASNGDAQSDCDYMCLYSDARPTCNVYIARDGVAWVLAAGATNTNGKGRALTFSRGAVPKDSANTWVVGIEGGNNGVGQDWPQPQMDAYFKASNAINARLGNLPSDVATHQVYAPDRKIDPATANAVEGPWQPTASTSSGTWNLPDIERECNQRASLGPTPIPTPPGDDDVEKFCVRTVDGWPYVTDFASYATPITEDQAARGRDLRGYQVGPDGGPYPLDELDSDLMLRLAGDT